MLILASAIAHTFWLEKIIFNYLIVQNLYL